VDRFLADYATKRDCMFQFFFAAAKSGCSTALASLAELETSEGRAISVFRRSSTKDELLRNCSEGKEIEFVDWTKIARINSFDLVINTVPSAAAAEVADDFQGVPVLLDALYSPWLPPLSLIQGKTHGELITGLDLLCAQALDQLELMTKIEFDHVFMFQKLRDHAANLVG
jgi:shikimate dehydrogenase